MVKYPSAQPAPRVPRSRRDDRYGKGQPMPYKQPGVGVVVSRQGDTVTVLVLGEELPGVIPLGKLPPVDAIVEIEARGELTVALDWTEEDGQPVLGWWYFTPAESPGWLSANQNDAPQGTGVEVVNPDPTGRGILWNRADFEVHPADTIKFTMLTSKLFPSVTATVQLVMCWDEHGSDPQPATGAVVAYGPVVPVNTELIEFTATAVVPDEFNVPPGGGSTRPTGRARVGLKYVPTGDPVTLAATLDVYDVAIPVTGPMSFFPQRMAPTTVGQWFPAIGKADSFTRPAVAPVRWNGTTLDVGSLVDLPSDLNDGADHFIRGGRTLVVEANIGSAGTPTRLLAYTTNPTTGTVTTATLGGGVDSAAWGYSHHLCSPYGDVVMAVAAAGAGGGYRATSYRINTDGTATTLGSYDSPAGAGLPSFAAWSDGGVVPVDTNKLIFPHGSVDQGTTFATFVLDLESTTPWVVTVLPDVFDTEAGGPVWTDTSEPMTSSRFFPGRPTGGKHVPGGGGRRPVTNDPYPIAEYAWTGTALVYMGPVDEAPRTPSPILGRTDYVAPGGESAGSVSELFYLNAYGDEGLTTEYIAYAEDRRWAALLNTSGDPAGPGILSTRGLQLSTGFEVADGILGWTDFDDTSGTAQVFILGIGGTSATNIDVLMQAAHLNQQLGEP